MAFYNGFIPVVTCWTLSTGPQRSPSTVFNFFLHMLSITWIVRPASLILCLYSAHFCLMQFLIIFSTPWTNFPFSFPLKKVIMIFYSSQNCSQPNQQQLTKWAINKAESIYFSLAGLKFTEGLAHDTGEFFWIKNWFCFLLFWFLKI